MPTSPATADLPLHAADVLEARKRLAGGAKGTPLLSHPVLGEGAGRCVSCKVEAPQRAGAVKFRGAYNAVASLDGEQRRGVVGASSGNHAQALALAGRLNGVPVTVVVPHDAPVSKVEGARSLGARIVTYQRERDDRDEMTASLA